MRTSRASGKILVSDPGLSQRLRTAPTVLITHEHSDQVDADGLRAVAPRRAHPIREATLHERGQRSADY